MNTSAKWLGMTAGGDDPIGSALVALVTERFPELRPHEITHELQCMMAAVETTRSVLSVTREPSSEFAKYQLTGSIKAHSIRPFSDQAISGAVAHLMRDLPVHKDE